MNRKVINGDDSGNKQSGKRSDDILRLRPRTKTYEEDKNNYYFFVLRVEKNKEDKKVQIITMFFCTAETFLSAGRTHAQGEVFAAETSA